MRQNHDEKCVAVDYQEPDTDKLTQNELILPREYYEFLISRF